MIFDTRPPPPPKRTIAQIVEQINELVGPDQDKRIIAWALLDEAYLLAYDTGYADGESSDLFDRTMAVERSDRTPADVANDAYALLATCDVAGLRLLLEEMFAMGANA